MNVSLNLIQRILMFHISLQSMLVPFTRKPCSRVSPLATLFMWRYNMPHILFFGVLVLCMASCAKTPQVSQQEVSVEVQITSEIEEGARSVKDDFASLNATAREGYYYQVAAYRGEMSQNILAQIEKYPYIVYVSEQDSKPLYRYLIGVYDKRASMNADRVAIEALTKRTHIQKHIKPLVRYVNKNNELVEVRKNGSLGAVVAQASEVRLGELAQAFQKESIKESEISGELANSTQEQTQGDEGLADTQATDTQTMANAENEDLSPQAQSEQAQNAQEQDTQNVVIVFVQEESFDREKCAQFCAAQNSQYYWIKEKRRTQGRRDNFISLPPSK